VRHFLAGDGATPRRSTSRPAAMLAICAASDQGDVARHDQTGRVWRTILCPCPVLDVVDFTGGNGEVLRLPQGRFVAGVRV